MDGKDVVGWPDGQEVIGFTDGEFEGLCVGTLVVGLWDGIEV